MYTLYKFHFLNGISEINQLFDDILIIWPAPVCMCVYIYIYIYIYIYNILTVYVQIHFQCMEKTVLFKIKLLIWFGTFPLMHDG